MVPPNPRRTCAHCGEYVGDTLHTCKPAEGTADHDAAAANQFAEKRAKYDTDCRDTRPTDWGIANLARAYLERGEALELEKQLHHYQQNKRIELAMAERKLSDAYVRLRSILDAFDTPHAPTPEQIWEHTEAKAKALKQRAEATEAVNKALREALEEIRDRFPDSWEAYKARKALESKPSPKWDIDEQHPDNRPLTEEQIRELKEYGID